MIEIITLPNDENLRTELAKLRAEAKVKGYRIRTYGRCHDKRTAFAQTGRRYYENQSNSNSIYSIDSPEAKYCYEWKVYRTETKQERIEDAKRYNAELRKNHPDIPSYYLKSEE